jgi:hypothetical protein
MQLPWTNQSADLDDTASGASMDKIIRIYRRDYDLLGSFYSV